MSAFSAAPRPRLPFSVIAKPTGAACNLDCSYCFFLSKEVLWDASGQRMSHDVLEAYVRGYLESSPTARWSSGGRAASRRCGVWTSSVRRWR